jgi:hypothetical protein
MLRFESRDGEERRRVEDSESGSGGQDTGTGRCGCKCDVM